MILTKISTSFKNCLAWILIANEMGTGGSSRQLVSKSLQESNSLASSDYTHPQRYNSSEEPTDF